MSPSPFLPRSKSRKADHSPNPGPFRHDDLEWGMRCVDCGKPLKAVSIDWPKPGTSGTHFWAHK